MNVVICQGNDKLNELNLCKYRTRLLKWLYMDKIEYVCVDLIFSSISEAFKWPFRWAWHENEMKILLHVYCNIVLQLSTMAKSNVNGTIYCLFYYHMY
jgi:hypothetical protein